MNKTKTIILALAILTSLTTGCQKQESTKQHTDRVIANVTESKTAFPYWLVFFAGHDGSKCNGCTMMKRQNNRCPPTRVKYFTLKGIV